MKIIQDSVSESSLLDSNKLSLPSNQFYFDIVTLEYYCLLFNTNNQDWSTMTFVDCVVTDNANSFEIARRQLGNTNKTDTSDINDQLTVQS